jgi:hypothetical protein
MYHLLEEQTYISLSRECPHWAYNGPTALFGTYATYNLDASHILFFCVSFLSG